MVILHIAAIENNYFNGVCVAVPQHVISQKEYAEVGFINIKNIKIEELKQYQELQMEFIKPFDIKRLRKPFDKPDIVVFHECYRTDYLMIARNLKKNGIMYIDIPHGELRLEAQQKKHIKKIIANALLFNNFIKHALAIQCLSQAEMEATNFGKKKIIGTNGIMIPIEKKCSFSEDGVKFIYIGRYEWKVKGLDLLFDAIKLKAEYLREKHVKFELYGPDVLGRFAQVTKLVKDNQIEDIVSLNYEIYGNEKKERLLNSDIFIQTSRHEGMPLGILEAMSYGIPCVVSEGTNLGEEISKNSAGWCCKNSSEDIAKCIVRAVENKRLLDEYGSNGRKLINARFVWKEVSKDTISKYKELLR